MMCNNGKHVVLKCILFIKNTQSVVKRSAGSYYVTTPAFFSHGCPWVTLCAYLCFNAFQNINLVLVLFIYYNYNGCNMCLFFETIKHVINKIKTVIPLNMYNDKVNQLLIVLFIGRPLCYICFGMNVDVRVH